ncbi:MAG: hypothetical protein ABJE66_10765 [Deltaproteobacteria bacterium]
MLKFHSVMLHARTLSRSISQWVEPRVKRVVAALSMCECCGDVAFARLCSDCRDKAMPHLSNDPYDIVGGEGGGWS